MKPWLILLVIILLLTACKTEKIQQPKPEPITLAKVYPGDILEVDKIQLLDGSSGERREVTDKGEIQKWLRQIKDIELIPDDNQEPRAGFRFHIELFKGEEAKLGFIPNSIKGIYYESNEELDAKVKTFFYPS